MIPHKLVIKNFLSYGETPTVIHFDAYHLICLSGKNGNGKSALLDALTWALWGQARKVSGVNKPDDGLLRLGTSRMLVTLEFTTNRQKYRVRREYIKSASKSATSLDLEIQRENGTFSSLTDKTIRATQDKINETVGVDFETFINSSFIRQGQSNEFSKKSPKERKEILSTILGLDHYQKLQSAALEKARLIQAEQDILKRLNAHAQTEIEKKETLQNSLNSIIKEEKKIRNIVAEQKKNLLAYEKKITELEKINIQTQHLSAQINKGQNDLSNGYQQLSTLQKEWKQIHHQSIHRSSTHDLHKNIEQKENEVAHYTRLHTEHTKLSTQEQHLHESIERLQQEDQKEKNSLSQEKNKYEIELTKSKTELEHQTLEQKKCLLLIQDIDKRINAAKDLKQTLLTTEKEQQTCEQIFEKRKSFYHMFVQKLQFIDKSKQELEEKKEQLEKQSSTHCPLCDQLVTAARKKFLHNALIKQEHFLNHQKQRVTKVLTQLKKILLEQHPLLQALQKKLQTLQQEQNQIVQIQKERITQEENLKAFSKKIDTLNDTIKQHENRISSYEKLLKKENPELLEQKKQRSEIKQLLINLNYNQTIHSSLQQELQSLYQSINPEHINKQETTKKVLFADIKNLIARLKEIKKQIKTAEQEKQSLPRFESEYTIVKTQKAGTIHHLEETQKQLETLLIEQTKLSNELQRIETLIANSKKQEDSIKKLQLEVNEYQTIAQAFSKNGIPALLIEEIVPELESEANRLLQRLTNNQAQIFIESVRDLKKGGVKETLDIHISDSAGIRPYEMFSGGEAFRIDFALRIAISKLLARKSGTALQTLIIDEGFGSQDDEGIQKIMDALYKIQNDFAKIIIVSHLPLMKDNFPVHFIIEKNALGSQIRIEERG